MAPASAFYSAQVEAQLKQGQPTLWLNPLRFSSYTSVSSAPGWGPHRLQDAKDRWQRLAPVIAEVFSDAPSGVIASPLRRLTKLSYQVCASLGISHPLFLKADNELPVCGSVKARGGMYEVLGYAEEVAEAAGLWRRGDAETYRVTPQLRALLGQHTVVVGSTGNLGLSVGVTAAALGMRAVVHMSAEAKEWKKQLLRSRGVQVVEHVGDYGEAVAAGRGAAEADSLAHFVDDESSEQLFLGYSTAALELKEQLEDMGVEVSQERPLVVHLPCGVGGAPGNLVAGCYTATDSSMLRGVADLVQVEGVFVEPSCAAAFAGPAHLHRLCSRQAAEAGASPPSPAASPGATMQAAARRLLTGGVHVLWATGGSLVPEDERVVLLGLGGGEAADRSPFKAG